MRSQCTLPDCTRPVTGLGFCNRHYLRFKQYGDPLGGGAFRYIAPLDRFLQLIDKRDDGCWIWGGYRARNGYGHITVGSETDGTKHYPLVHRWSYEQFVGPIPRGLTIDHLCRNTMCVNPAHLEAVTIRDNIRRSPRAMSAYCKHGHLFDAVSTSGQRRCTECRRAASRAYQRRKRTQ